MNSEWTGTCALYIRYDEETDNHQITSRFGTAPLIFQMVFEDFDTLTYSKYIENPLSTVSYCNTNYIVEEKAHDFFKFQNSMCIHLLHINARSMKSDFQRLNLYYFVGTLTAVAITETGYLMQLKIHVLFQDIILLQAVDLPVDWR